MKKEKDYTKLGGWLLLFTIINIIDIFLFIYVIIILGNCFVDGSMNLYLDKANSIYDPYVYYGSIFLIIIAIIQVILCLIIYYYIKERKQGITKFVVIVYVLAILTNVFDFDKEDFFMSIVFAYIWISYFRESVRCKKYFINK